MTTDTDTETLGEDDYRHRQRHWVKMTTDTDRERDWVKMTTDTQRDWVKMTTDTDRETG